MLPSYNSDAYSNVTNVFVYSVAVSVFVGLSVNVFVWVTVFVCVVYFA